MSIRKITFGGNLTADPELRQIGENTVCNFSVACNDYQGGQEVFGHLIVYHDRLCRKCQSRPEKR